jgi:hypothetical protein
MSIFTGRELEFLAGLNKSWWRLYWKEFSRLRRIEIAASNNGAPETLGLSACDEDSVRALRRSGSREGSRDLPQRRVELAAGNR